MIIDICLAERAKNCCKAGKLFPRNDPKTSRIFETKDENQLDIDTAAQLILSGEMNNMMNIEIKPWPYVLAWT